MSTVRCIARLWSLHSAIVLLAATLPVLCTGLRGPSCQSSPLAEGIAFPPMRPTTSLFEVCRLRSHLAAQAYPANLYLRGGQQRTKQVATGGDAVSSAYARGGATSRAGVKRAKENRRPQVDRTKGVHGIKMGYDAGDYAALSNEVTRQVENKVKEQMTKESREEEEAHRKARSKSKKRLRKRQGTFQPSTKNR